MVQQEVVNIPFGKGGNANDISMPSGPRSLYDMVDYQGFITNKYTGEIGGNPAVIGMSKGFLIYTTGVRVNGNYHKYNGGKSVFIDYSGKKR